MFEISEHMDIKCSRLSKVIENHSIIRPRLIADILAAKKQKPCLFDHVRFIHIVHIGCFVCSAGYVTSPFITPHGQLSAEGKMEVVSWGPAGRYGYH